MMMMKRAKIRTRQLMDDEVNGDRDRKLDGSR